MPGKNPRKITISDIAKRVKLARGTVSMAMNDDPRIAQATRDRVRKIIKELNYRPNEAARRLRGGKSGMIAYICPRFTSPFAAEMLAAAEQRAFETKRYERGIVPFSTWNYEQERDKLLESIVYERKADAVVLMTIRPPEKFIKLYRDSGIPLVVIEFGVEGAHSIIVDNVKGGRLAAGYMLEKYGPDTAIISGHIMTEKGKDIHPAAVDRLKGFECALKESGFRLPASRIKTVYYYNRKEGNEIMTGMITDRKVPRSIFCAAGDDTAIGLIDIAVKHGLRVPQDIAIVGYDDMPIAAVMQPALTTIRQPLREIGTMAFDLAVDAAEGLVSGVKHITVEPELVIRGSA